jgi:hypothetical protein
MAPVLVDGVWIVFIHPDPTQQILKELEEYESGERSLDELLDEDEGEDD